MHPVRKLWCRIYQTAFRIALPVLPYREPKPLKTFGEAADLLVRKKIARVLIVTDRNITQLGLTRELEQDLTKRGVAYTIFDEVVPNPTISNVEAARERYLADGCGAIIAFGGGSAMDCAKVTGARIVRPKKPVTKMRGILRVLRPLPLLIAVPTTAGTGSETTLAAVITDDKTHYKYPINDFCLIPHYAVLDYRTTLGLPAHITATTGMDALVHATEAYIGRSTTRETRERAIEAVSLIRSYLLRAYRDGSDAEARAQMLHAAYCAGIAFTKSYVGYVHAVAHSLGGQYGIAHGLANAVLLPYFLDEYGEACEKRLAELARRSGVAAADAEDAEAARTFITWTRDMNEQMGIPTTLPGIRNEDIPAMAAHADAEGNPLYPVPRLMDAHELERMYHVVQDPADADGDAEGTHETVGETVAAAAPAAPGIVARMKRAVRAAGRRARRAARRARTTIRQNR